MPEHHGGLDVGPTNLTDRRGVNLVEGLVLNEFGWVFREQPVSDEGVDAQIETRVEQRTTGRLLALQIKTGPSYFSEPKDDGWILRFKERQARLWLDHALPVIIVLVDPDVGTAYWQRVTPSTIVPTGKAFKVHVPATQTVPSARDSWEHFASGIEARAGERYVVALTALPPGAAETIGKLHELYPEDAAVLALHMAEGRRNPEATVKALLLAEPPWLAAKDGLGWMSVGMYAASHNLLSLSADAFELAAGASEEHRGKRLAAAGINATGYDRDRARKLFDEASRFTSAELLVRIGQAALNHPQQDAGPRVIDPPLDEVDPAVATDAFIQDFLCDQCQRSGDIESAIVHARRAIELEPDNTDYGASLALALGRRALRARSNPDDLREAAILLSRAVDQRHAWDGPTEQVLDDLLRVLALTGDNEAILNYTRIPPMGIARPEEAQRPESLRHALVAASRLSREDLVSQIAGDLGHSARDELDRAQVGLITLSADKTLTLWRQVAAEADADYQALLGAVLHEARLGFDDTARLTSLADQGIVPTGAVRLATLLCQAHVDVDAALPGLRSLARTDISAAEHLISILVDNSRFDEAAAACRTARDIFKQDYFLIAEAEVYLDADDLEEAEAAGIAAVAAEGFPRDRAKLLTFLAQQAANRGDWALAEDYLTRVLPLHSETRSSDVWRVIIAQLHRGEGARAASTVLRYSPSVETKEEATLWLQAMVAVPWDQPIASTALSLAVRFENEEELAVALLSSIISSTTTASDAEPDGPSAPSGDGSSQDPRPVVDADLHKRAFAAMERLVDRNPESRAIQRLQGSTEELLQHITLLLKKDSERNKALRELLDKVQKGDIPIGLLATGTGKSYALLLVQQATGPLVAAAAQDEEHDLDQSAAAEAVNRPVVVDSSALLLSSQLTGGDLLRGQFTDLLLPATSRRDIVRATVEVRGLASSPGSLAWDDQTQRPAFSELNASDLLRYQSRAEALEIAAEETVTRPVQAMPLFPDLSDGGVDDAWLAPIQLAHDASTALWSDDLGQRRLARSVGVPAFGTPSLVDFLNQAEIDRLGADDDDRLQELVAERHGWVRQFIRESVVDVPAHLEDLISQAEVDEWRPWAAATALTRPSWWAWQKNAVGDWGVFIEAAARNNCDATPTWQQAAMLGVSRTYVNADFGSAMLAVVALVGLGRGSRLDDSVAGLVRARDVAQAAGLPDPVSHLAVAARGMAKAGRIDDADQFTTAVLSALSAGTAPDRVEDVAAGRESHAQES